jgi:hypothetical protein
LGASSLPEKWPKAISAVRQMCPIAMTQEPPSILPDASSCKLLYDFNCVEKGHFDNFFSYCFFIDKLQACHLYPKVMWGSF